MSNIRKAVSGDIPRLSELRGSVRENRLSNPGQITPRDYEWFIEHSAIWVREAAGRIVGLSAADPRDGSIWALFVDPAHEGQGIGRSLLDRACADLRRAGHVRARLSTDPGTCAERFYRLDGWTEIGTTPDGEIMFEKHLRHPGAA